MPSRWWITAVALCLLLPAGAALADSPAGHGPQRAPVAPRVLEDLALTGSANVLVVFGEQADLRATFQELSRLTPESIKLNSMRLTRIKRIIKVQLYGRAIQPEVENDQTEVERFVAALTASPLFEEVNLRNVERSLFAGETGERFDASFQVILAPDPGAVQIASGEEREP